MKAYIALFVAAFALAGTSSAQLTYDVVGDTGVKAQFTFTIDDGADSVTVFVNNNVPGIDGASGRITSFGFFVPFTDMELGTNGSNVSFLENAPGDWAAFEPYELMGDSGIYVQVYGVGTGPTEQGGSGDPGVAYGSNATFVFTFPPFGPDAAWGGDDSLSVRFQSIDNSLSGIPGDSDKVLASSDDGGGGGTGFVPEPSTYGMLGVLALLALMTIRHTGRR